MRFEADVLFKELAELGLSPRAPAQPFAGVEVIRAELVPGLPCLFRLSEPSTVIFDLACVVTVPVRTDERLAEIERITMMLDDLVTPCRIVAADGELGLSVHGSWGDAEGLVELALESVLLLRRLSIAVLAPLVALTEGRSSEEETFKTILEGLRSDPTATSGNAVTSKEASDV
jgi:hypothetical protein